MYTSINDTSEVLLIYRFIGGHMISTCTLFFMVSMTQHFKFVLSHYMNVLLILWYNSCCQNKLISVSVSVSDVIQYLDRERLMQCFSCKKCYIVKNVLD